MSDSSMLTATLQPGDPPPFWEGAWHPEGKTNGAIMVTPLVGPSSLTAIVPARPPVSSVPAPTPAQPAPSAEPPAPPVAERAPIAPPVAADPLPAPTAERPVTPAAEAPPAAVPAPASTPPTGTGSLTGAPSSGTGPLPGAPTSGTGPLGAPRSFVLAVSATAPLSPMAALPVAVDPAGAEALRARGKELQTANQLGQALQAYGQAIARAPGDPAGYAQLGQALLAGRAWEDAGHHFLIAYMLAPREAAYGRMMLNAAWVLGYVGWSFQIAQALYKTQPAADLAEMGRQAQAWLQSRPAAVTSLCPACRTTTILAAPGPCAKCGGTPMCAPANAVGFAGLKLLQQAAPKGRLFAGATCASCQGDTVLVVGKRGPSCQLCAGPALAAM